MSSIHLISKPPFEFSHSEKAEWMSRVLSSFGKPVKERMRVTDAESWEMEVDIVAGVEEGGDFCQWAGQGRCDGERRGQWRLSGRDTRRESERGGDVVVQQKQSTGERTEREAERL